MNGWWMEKSNYYAITTLAYKNKVLKNKYNIVIIVKMYVEHI